MKFPKESDEVMEVDTNPLPKFVEIDVISSKICSFIVETSHKSKLISNALFIGQGHLEASAR